MGKEEWRLGLSPCLLHTPAAPSLLMGHVCPEAHYVLQIPVLFQTNLPPTCLFQSRLESPVPQVLIKGGKWLQSFLLSCLGLLSSKFSRFGQDGGGDQVMVTGQRWRSNSILFSQALLFSDSQSPFLLSTTASLAQLSLWLSFHRTQPP